MRGRQLDRFEQEDDGFHERVRDGFRAMADGRTRPVGRASTAASDIEQVAAAIRRAVADRLGL